MFEDSDGKASELPVVWADVEKILSAVSEERNFIGKVFVKAMADGGQGFLKVCLIILPEDFDNDATDSDDSKGEPSKRSTYEEGGGIGTYKLISVKRVIMLAIVPDCKETHKNMKALFDLTQLNRISFLFVADFKLLLICLGCQTATSTKPCPYCLISLKQLTPDDDNEDPPVDFVETSIEKFEERTFGNLQESHTKFVNEYASNKKKAKFCNSTINANIRSQSLGQVPTRRTAYDARLCKSYFFQRPGRSHWRGEGIELSKELELCCQRLSWNSI